MQMKCTLNGCMCFPLEDRKKKKAVCVTAIAYEAVFFGIVFLFLYIAPRQALEVATDIKFVQQTYGVRGSSYFLAFLPVSPSDLTSEEQRQLT